MTHRTGRNEPCPCGSGKKYKHCCLNASPPPDDDPSAVVSRALIWLQSRHGRAVNDAIDIALFDDLDDDEGQCYDELDDETGSFITTQAYEWLLAEDEIQASSSGTASATHASHAANSAGGNIRCGAKLARERPPRTRPAAGFAVR